MITKSTLIDSPKNTEGKSETDNKDAQPPVFHPKYSGVAGRATVRFKDLPEDSYSPIIGIPPPRRSLFPTAAPSVTPEVRSTPFPTIEEREKEDESPSRRGLEFKPQRLQRSETSETATAGPTLTPTSTIDVTIPYVDPPTPSSSEEEPEERKPVFNCTSVPNIRLKNL